MTAVSAVYLNLNCAMVQVVERCLLTRGDHIKKLLSEKSVKCSWKQVAMERENCSQEVSLSKLYNPPTLTFVYGQVFNFLCPIIFLTVTSLE